jgi:hypothetical protein
MSRRRDVEALVDRVTKECADRGAVIEAGWRAFEIIVLDPADATPLQRDEMRKAFFCGAQHLWGSINRVLDAGDEPTAADMRRFDLISTELSAFVAEMAAAHYPTKGTG